MHTSTLFGLLTALAFSMSAIATPPPTSTKVTVRFQCGDEAKPGELACVNKTKYALCEGPGSKVVIQDLAPGDMRCKDAKDLLNPPKPRTSTKVINVTPTVTASV